MSPLRAPGKLALRDNFIWDTSIWNPSMITTALWLDAADASTISTSGSEVTQINDKSGNARNFTGSSGSRPSTGLATQGGKNVLSFDADFLTSASSAATWKFLHDSTGSSLFSVVQFGLNSNPDTRYNLAGNNGSTSSNTGYDLGFDDRSSQSRNNRIVLQASLSAGGANNAILSISGDGVITPNAHQILSAVCDPANATTLDRSFVRVNAGSEIKTNTGTSAPTASDPTYTLQIGANGNNANLFSGQLAEVIVIAGIISILNRQRIEGYLAHKWGLTANLPSDHPYKTVGPTP